MLALRFDRLEPIKHLSTFPLHGKVKFTKKRKRGSFMINCLSKATLALSQYLWGAF